MGNLKYMVDKFNNLYILIVCLLHAVLHGKAVRKVVNPHKILILQMAKLGDMVCTTPMFRAVKEKYPDAELYVIGNAINKELLVGNNDVDEYIIFNKKNFWGLVSQLHQKKIDFACQTSPSFGFLAMFYLAGIKSIATPKIENGFCPWETKSYKILRKLVMPIPHRMGSYAPREYLRLLEPIGIYTNKTTKYLSYSGTAHKHILNFLYTHHLAERKFAIISPSSGNKIKRWPADRFARVAEYIVSKNLPVVVIGGSGDKKEVKDMILALERTDGIIDSSEKFSVDEIKALIAQARLFVSVDTGPIYIAEAFGVPTVDIVGPMDEREQPPTGNIHKVVVPWRDTPQLHIMNARVYNEEDAILQVDTISVDMVCSAIDLLSQK